MRYLFCLLLVYLPFFAKAAEVPSIHYTIKDGLPSNTVYAIYQDKEGYIWLATDKGIARYNGLSFRNYTTNDGLSDNDCLSLHTDLYGRMWILTYNGSLMYYKDGVFHTAANTPFLHVATKDGMVSDIHTEQDSSVTIYFLNKSFFLNVQKEKIHIYTLANIYKTQKSSSLNLNKVQKPSSLSYIWKSSPSTYELCYWETAELVTIDTLSNILHTKRYCSSNHVYQSVVGDYRFSYFICNRNLYHIKDQTYFRALPKEISDKSRIQCVFNDKNIYAVATNYGLFVNDSVFFPGKNITSFFKDKDGNYWLSTLNEGVYKISASFLKTISIANSYRSKAVYGIMMDQNLLFGTQNRDVYLVNQNNSSRLFKCPSSDSNEKNNAHLFDGIQYYNFAHTGPGAERKNFILRQLDQKVQQQEVSNHFKYSINLKITNIFIHRPYLYFITDKRRLLWTDYNNWSDNNRQNTQHQIYPKNHDLELIYHSMQAPDGSLWFSTLNYLYQVKDTIADVQAQFKGISFRQFIINKHYLIGYTFENRLIVCNRYTAKNMIIDSVADNSCLWDKFYPINDSVIIATTNGLYRLIQTHASGGMPSYSISIPESQFLPQSAEYIFSNGIDCYFFKEQSITRLPVSDLFRTPTAPALSFSSIRTTDSNFIKISPSVILSYKQAQNISIGFSAISFNTPDLSYEYAISQNNDNDVWVESNNESINLYKLRSGEYSIKIRAKTPAGTYSPVCSFVLTINRPFWLSWWFLLIDAAIAGGFTWLLVRYYTRKATARKEEELQQKEQEMKFLKSEYKALNALMNPHFIFNTLNSVQSLINKDDKQASSEHIRTVADLIRQNMHNVARDLITLEEELTLVINYLKLEQLRFSWLRFELDIDDAIDTDDVMVPPLILQPLVENAILHGLWPAKLQQGIINIRVMKKEKSIVIEIRDNGKGFSNSTNKDRNPNHKSTAVNNISSRMQQLSAMHGKSYTFRIEELKNGEIVSGVTATIEIEI